MGVVTVQSLPKKTQRMIYKNPAASHTFSVTALQATAGQLSSRTCQSAAITQKLTVDSK